MLLPGASADLRRHTQRAGRRGGAAHRRGGRAATSIAAARARAPAPGRAGPRAARAARRSTRPRPTRSPACRCPSRGRSARPRVARRAQRRRSTARVALAQGRSSLTWPIVAAAMLVAIDGPAGAGKSTVARAVAQRARLHLPGLRGDVPRRGARRRRAIRRALRHRASTAIACCSTARTSREAIRTPEVSAGGLAAVPPTPPCARRCVDMQRALIADGDWVAEGRDIGTVVAPDAEVKVWLTADADERAPAPRASPLDEVRERDERDARAASTRRWWPRADAVEVDTTGLGIDEVVGADRRARGARRDEGRGRRLPQRRQVLARQPPDAARARRSSTSAPGITRDRNEIAVRVERPALHAHRHRRHGLRSTTTRSPARSASRPRPRSTTPAWRCSSSTRAPACGPGDEELADLLRRWQRAGRSSPPTRSTRVGDIPLAADFYAPRPGRAARGVGRAGPGHRRPARPRRRRAARRGRRARGGGRRDPPGRHRAPERRQVDAGQPLPGRRARDRLRRRRHHARRDRPAARGRRAASSSSSTPPACAARPRSPESVEYYTTLRSQRAAERADVALVVCDAARRRHRQDLRIAELAMKEGCATALVLNKWDVAAMDEADLDHERAARAPEAAPAPEGADRQRADRPQRPARAQRGDRRSATGCTTASRRPSSTASWPRPCRPASRPPSRATGSSCSTWRRSGPRPPRFAIQVNSRNRVTRDYAYFLENRLRARYGMDGVPLIIDFNERKQRRSERS